MPGLRKVDRSRSKTPSAAPILAPPPPVLDSTDSEKELEVIGNGEEVTKYLNHNGSAADARSPVSKSVRKRTPNTTASSSARRKAPAKKRSPAKTSLLDFDDSSGEKASEIPAPPRQAALKTAVAAAKRKPPAKRAVLLKDDESSSEDSNVAPSPSRRNGKVAAPLKGARASKRPMITKRSSLVASSSSSDKSDKEDESHPSPQNQKTAGSASKRSRVQNHSPKRGKTGGKKAKLHQDEDSFDSADDQISDVTKNDSSDDDFSDSSEEELDQEESDLEEDESFGRARKATATKRPKSKATPARISSTSRRPSSRSASRRPAFDVDSDKSGGSSGDDGKRRTPVRNRARTRKASRRQEPSEESRQDTDSTEVLEDLNGSPRRTSTRKSARKANRRLASFKGEKVEPAFPKRKSTYAVDTEYEDAEVEHASDLELSEDDEELESGLGVGVVRDDDVGTADESSGNEGHNEDVGVVRDDDIGTADESETEAKKKPKHTPPTLQLMRVARQTHAHHGLQNSEEEDSEEDSGGAKFTDSPPKIVCDSEFDTITCEKLPDDHICFYPPDGTSRHCFALGTLRQIALMAAQQGHPKLNRDGSLAFLQPPHFRTIMSDDLQDQIASRFGREALQIRGPFYNKNRFDPTRSETIDIDLGDANHEDEDFRDRVNRYIGSVMGSSDLYCCPLCYTVAFNQVGSEPHVNESSQAKPGKERLSMSTKYVADFDLDPMSILGDLDNQNMDLASTFCFRTAAQVKQHLRVDHVVDTRGVTGNDLYTRFQIRSQDGLLQRYLKRINKGKPVKHGYMLKYWNEGYNHDFVHLLLLVDEAKYFRAVVASKGVDEEKREKAEDFLRVGQEFFEAFDAKDLWTELSAPYRFNDPADIDDFIAGAESGDESDGSEGRSSRAVYRDLDRQAIEDEMQEDEALIERYRRLDENNDNLRNTSDERSEEEDVAEDDVVAGEYADEESEDEWMASKRASLTNRLRTTLKKKPHRRSPAQRRKSNIRNPGRKRPSLADDSDEEVASPGAKRRSIQESEGDNDSPKALEAHDSSAEEEF